MQVSVRCVEPWPPSSPLAWAWQPTLWHNWPFVCHSRSCRFYSASKPKISSTVSSKAPWSFSIFCIHAAFRGQIWNHRCIDISIERTFAAKPPTFSSKRSKKKCPLCEDRIKTTWQKSKEPKSIVNILNLEIQWEYVERWKVEPSWDTAEIQTPLFKVWGFPKSLVATSGEPKAPPAEVNWRLPSPWPSSPSLTRLLKQLELRHSNLVAQKWKLKIHSIHSHMFLGDRHSGTINWSGSTTSKAWPRFLDSKAEDNFAKIRNVKDTISQTLRRPERNSLVVAQVFLGLGNNLVPQLQLRFNTFPWLCPRIFRKGAVNHLNQFGARWCGGLTCEMRHIPSLGLTSCCDGLRVVRFQNECHSVTSWKVWQGKSGDWMAWRSQSELAAGGSLSLCIDCSWTLVRTKRSA